MIYEKKQNFGKTYKYNKFLAERIYNEKKYKHEGLDLLNTKGTLIKAELSGIIVDVYEDYENLKGLGIRIKTNLGYLDEKLKNIIIYHDYYHLYKINEKIGNFVKCGKEIGKMGNSGNCWFFDDNNKKWKKIEVNQAKDINFQPGSHLHFDFFITSNQNKLSKIIINKIKCDKKELLLKQFGVYYINPELFFKFLDKSLLK